MSFMNRRYLALWLPYLPTDRLARRGHAGSPERPLVVIEKMGSALRIVAADRHAARLGLAPSLTLADARARVPEITAFTYDVAADRRLLERLADICIRYTPMVAIDPPDTLLLDITGTAHLFGGETELARKTRTHLRRHGVTARHALADTPDAARALAQFSAPDVTALPVAALRLGGERETALRRAGLHSVGDIACRPLSGLAARFGADAATAVRRILGDAANPIAPRRTRSPIIAIRRFPEPVARTDYVLGVLADLLAEVGAMLAARGVGGRRFQAAFFRADGRVCDLAVETVRPVRSAGPVMELFTQTLARLDDPLDPGFGFDAVQLAVPVTEPLPAAQPHLDRTPPPGSALAALIDRLSARLAPERVLRFHPADSHIPERGERLHPGAPTEIWPAPPSGEPPLRPLYLFTPPRPLAGVLADVPDGPPRRFHIGSAAFTVARGEGPERIAAEWWRSRGLTRDYYRVEDSRGRRLWIFRHGLYGRETPEPRWYLHGLFA